MANYLVSFNIPILSERFGNLVSMIRHEPGWARINDGTYIVDSNKTAVQLRDALKGNLVTGESLLVAELSNTAAWSGLSTEVSDWINKTL